MLNMKQLESENASTTSSTESDSELPYPAPISRADFLNPDFSAFAYLSTLRNRHQTLEDLRSELRARSSLLSKELLDLVNAEYEDFVLLGTSLAGGEEKLEEVRLGLMGFRRDLEGIRAKVVAEEKEITQLLDERKRVRKEIQLGRDLLALDAALTELEDRLSVDPESKQSRLLGNGQREERLMVEADDYSSEDHDLDTEGEDAGVDGSALSLKKLNHHVTQYQLVKKLAKRVHDEHPFVIALRPRIMQVKNTLLLDLGSVFRQNQRPSPDHIMALLGLYRQMDEAKEAVHLLKSLRNTQKRTR